MIIAAVIRNENEILLCRTSDVGNEAVWELPSCEISECNNFIMPLVEKCKIYGVAIEVTDVFLEGGMDDQQIIVYNTNLFSLSNSNNYACWVDARQLRNLIFSKQYEGVVNKLINVYDTIFAIQNEIEQVVDELNKELGIKTELMASYNSFQVFVHNDYGNYCPFIFSIEYEFESETEIKVIHLWHITRMHAEGDNSDLHVLFSNLMSILLKCFFQKNVYIDYLNFINPFEVSAATIVFKEMYKRLNIKKFREVIEKIYSMYTFCLMLFENFVGSFSLVRNDKMFSSQNEKYFCSNGNFNCFSREEHQYYSNLVKGVSLLSINNGVYYARNLLKAHQWEFVDGIDGKILYQVDMEKESFNYVSHDDWKRILKVIKDMGVKEYTIVCQINHLYLLERSNIWIFEGDFSDYGVTIEKEKILKRQSLENRILYFNRVFKWRYPVNPGRFEELISDLLETDIMVQSVRLVGKSNDADGGRDLLIYKKYLQDAGTYRIGLQIGQCKAYEKSVNKSHVRDIRDTLDYHNANGFFLAVTSVITSQLIDHLCKLKEKRDVDWWTEREIFKKLRQNPQIADGYFDILVIEN